MKSPLQPVDASRRNFIRNAALAGLTTLTAALVLRGNAQACVNEGLCPGCLAYDDCNLPRALSRKQAIGAEGIREP